MLKSEKGLALVAVAIFTCIFTILGFSLLKLAETEIILTQKDVNKTKAFYLAEAGLGVLTARLYNEEFGSVDDTALGEGSYRIDVYSGAEPPYAISTGRVGEEEKRIRVELSFLARPYECGVYAGNSDGQQWVFSLRGQGDPQAVGGSREVGGKDIVNGNIFIDGDVTLYEESSVNPSPFPNPYEFEGDVDATGTVSILDTASVSGAISEGVAPQGRPDLLGMNYVVNNTHNVSQIFAGQGISSGHLPSDHQLYDVVVKNPTDRSAECDSTAGDDYFLEPASVTGGGDQKDARTPLHLGDNRIYYVDGNVWVHHKTTYGFLVDGKATIVATGNIHISDNVKYADSESLLGLVALGQYDSNGQLVSGGNIYFGDPRYGTMYTISALMFAADSFLYNTDSVSGDAEEPETGFSVYGNLTALNEVSIDRDWYDEGGTGQARPAYFTVKKEPGDTSHGKSAGEWVDLETGASLNQAEIVTLRHYQMILTYDDRVRSQDTQPPALPKGEGTIFGGLTHWEELPSSQ
ncbi:MAG: hypothetical protein AMJ43_00625 [Coxiella sp. DG_40]|nr:MAG: hypothetical protein AMJ43_00625 [Coxiella sp. DG_40]